MIIFDLFEDNNKKTPGATLAEFAPSDSSNGDDGFSEETLKQLAAQWYNGDEDPEVERTLMAAGWEIGQDEGYDDEPGVFVVQAGDVNGNSYISWPADELRQGVAEGVDLINMTDLQFYKELLAVLLIPVTALGVSAWNKVMNSLRLYRAEEIVQALSRKGITVDRDTFDQIKPLLQQLEQAIDVNNDGDAAKELAQRIQQTVSWGKLKQPTANSQSPATARDQQGVTEGQYEIHHLDPEGRRKAIYHHGKGYTDDVIRKDTQYHQKQNPRDTFRVFKDKQPFDWQGVTEAIREKGALKAAQDAAKFIIRNLDDRNALRNYSAHFWSPEKFYQGATMAMRPGTSIDDIVKAIKQDRPAQFESVGDKITDPAPSKEFVSNKFYVKFTPTGIEFYRKGELVHTKSGDYSNPTRGDYGIAKGITAKLWEKEYQQGLAEGALTEMDKSQKSPAGWNLDDYDYSKGKWTRGKIVTAKDAVKDMGKELNRAFNNPDLRDKKKGVKESALTEMNRRGFLRGLAGLAASAAAPTPILKLLSTPAGISSLSTPAGVTALGMTAGLALLKGIEAHLDQYDPEDDDAYFEAWEDMAAELGFDSTDADGEYIDPLGDLINLYNKNPKKAAQQLIKHIQSEAVNPDDITSTFQPRDDWRQRAKLNDPEDDSKPYDYYASNTPEKNKIVIYTTDFDGNIMDTYIRDNRQSDPVEELKKFIRSDGSDSGSRFYKYTKYSATNGGKPVKIAHEKYIDPSKLSNALSPDQVQEKMYKMWDAGIDPNVATVSTTPGALARAATIAKAGIDKLSNLRNKTQPAPTVKDMGPIQRVKPAPALPALPAPTTEPELNLAPNLKQKVKTGVKETLDDHERCQYIVTLKSGKRIRFLCSADCDVKTYIERKYKEPVVDIKDQGIVGEPPVELLPGEMKEAIKNIKGPHGRQEVDTDTPGVTRVRQTSRLGAKTFGLPSRPATATAGEKTPVGKNASSLTNPVSSARRINPRLDRDDSGQLASYSAETTIKELAPTQKQPSDQEGKIAAELRKLRAQYPDARSDIEAVAIGGQEAHADARQNLARVDAIVSKLDRAADQLQSANVDQDSELNVLDRENNDLEQKVKELEKRIGQLKQPKSKDQPTQAQSTEPQNEPAAKASPTAKAEPAKAKDKPKTDLDTDVPLTPEYRAKLATQMAQRNNQKYATTPKDLDMIQKILAKDKAPYQPSAQDVTRAAEKTKTQADLFRQHNDMAQGEPVTEVSPEYIERYKKEHGKRATAADQAGDYAKGHEHFKKINKLTKQQFQRGAKPEKVDEISNFMTQPTEPVSPEEQWKRRIRLLAKQYQTNASSLAALAKENGPDSAEAVAYEYLRDPSKIRVPGATAPASAVNWDEVIRRLPMGLSGMALLQAAEEYLINNKGMLRSTVRSLLNNDENQRSLSAAYSKKNSATESVTEELDNDEVGTAITRRIMVGRKDLLLKYGPRRVMQAVEYIADRVGLVNKISDNNMATWVSQVEQVLGGMTEAKATSTRLDPKCWTGKKIGNPKTKVKGGVRVNNCVPK